MKIQMWGSYLEDEKQKKLDLLNAHLLDHLLGIDDSDWIEK